MTNPIALVLGIAVALALLADFWLNSGGAAYFLARKLIDFLDWIAFWR